MKFKNGTLIESSIPFKTHLIPKSNKTSRPQNKMSPESITVHNTGNANATAKNNTNYVDNADGYVSWHFTIGDNIVYQELPINENAWHAGDGTNGKGNRTSIGIEISEKEGDKAYLTAIKFIAELLEYFNWGVDKIIPHKHWSGKYCPRLILPKWDSDFIPKITLELNKKEDSMGERVNIKIKSGIYAGDIVEDIEKVSYEKLDKYLMSHELIEEPEVPDNCLTLPSSDLQYGSTGNDVRHLQIILNMITDRLNLGTIDIDGSFGNQSKGAINKFRQHHNLTQNGLYNQEVRGLLIKEELSKKTITYKSGNTYYAEIHKDNLHGRKEEMNGYEFDAVESNGYANATFRWDYNGHTYAQSPFIADGIVHENRTIMNYGAPDWLGDPMPIFSISQDNEVTVNFENNPQSKNYKFAVGGIKMYPQVSFEGFEPQNISALDYATKRHCIAENPFTDRILIAYSTYATIYTLADSVNNKGYINTVGLDSGGSSQVDLGNVKRNYGRTMICWIVFPK